MKSSYLNRFLYVLAIKNMEKLLDMMEDDDDVQNVWHNWDNE